MKLLNIFLIFTILFCSFSSFAKKSKNVSKEQPSQSTTLRYIDNTQRFISDHWTGLNYNLDSYFSDQKYRRNQNKSRISAFYEVYKKEGEKIQKYYDIEAKVHFPKVSKKLSITVEKEWDEVTEARSSAANKGQATKDSSYAAGIDFLLYKSPYWKTSFNTGLKLLLPLDPYAKLKIYRGINTKFIDISAAQKFIYYRQDGVSEITQLSFFKQLSNKFSISLDNTLSWTDQDDIFVQRNALSLHHQIDDKKALSYSAGANAYLSPCFYYYSYDASISYRQQLYKKWLYGNLSVGADFSKSNNFDMINFILMRMEVLFI